MTPLDNGLLLSASLRLGLRAIEALPPVAEREALARQNERVLRGLLALEESPERDGDEEGLHPELQRLDLKLGLLMELVGELLGRELELPPFRALRFNAHGLACTLDAAPPPGSLLVLELYLHDSLPRPLRLFGEALPNAPGPDNLLVAFRDLPDTLADHIEKHIFRQHRREVARRREGRGG